MLSTRSELILQIFYVGIIILRAKIVSWHLPDWTGENHQNPPARIFGVPSEFRTRRLANASSKSSPFQPSCTFGGGIGEGGLRLHVLNTNFFTPILFKLHLVISHVKMKTLPSLHHQLNLLAVHMIQVTFSSKELPVYCRSFYPCLIFAHEMCDGLHHQVCRHIFIKRELLVML